MVKDIHIDVKGQSEDALQQKCYFWFHNTHPDLRGLLHHSPNGGARGWKDGKTFKLIGTQPGFPDLILVVNSKVWFFELKTTTGKLSAVQVEYHKKLEKQGFHIFLIRSLEEFKRVINIII